MILKQGSAVSPEALRVLARIEEVFKRYEVTLVALELEDALECSVKRVPRFRREALRDEIRRALGQGWTVSGGQGSERLRVERRRG